MSEQLIHIISPSTARITKPLHFVHLMELTSVGTRPKALRPVPIMGWGVPFGCVQVFSLALDKRLGLDYHVANGAKSDNGKSKG